MTHWVKCVRDYPEKGKKIFNEGEVYEIDGMFGDPQRAIEEFGIEDGMPLDCISFVSIKKNENKTHHLTPLYTFKVSPKYEFTSSVVDVLGSFNDYFDILTKEELEYYKNIEKYNL